MKVPAVIANTWNTEPSPYTRNTELSESPIHAENARNIIVRVVAENFSSPAFIAMINANGESINTHGMIPPESIRLAYNPVDAPYHATTEVTTSPTTIHENTLATKFLESDVVPSE